MLAQTWDDLLFAHWRVDETELRRHVPPQLELETFGGEAWLGITPFRITRSRARGMLPVPYLSSFLELNVRTYVRAEDKPGIWFFSLDTESELAVRAARTLYRLPYFRARMSARVAADGVHYASARRDSPRPAVFHATYRATGDGFTAAPGSLESFLAERYCLYAEDRGTLYRAEIHHPPWPLQPATCDVELNSLPPAGIDVPDEAPLCHFSRRQDVVIWPLGPLAGSSAPAAA